VEIISDGQNVTDELVKEGFGYRLPMIPKGPAYINYVKDTDDFSIQMDASTELLEKIVKFCGFHKQVAVDDPKDGMLVEAYCPKYQNWNRARILSVEPTYYIVDFIDYGHNQKVEKICAIDDPYIESIPPLAIKCKLHKTTTNQSIEERFKEFAAKGTQKFSVSMIRMEENGRAVVDVFFKGQNILAILSDPSLEIPRQSVNRN
jgi:Tudor domain